MLIKPLIYNNNKSIFKLSNLIKILQIYQQFIHE